MSSLPGLPVGLRRSPRSAAKLCKGIKMEGLTAEQSGLLLSLAHYTGWSADRIRLKIKEVTNVDTKAEDVWSFHWRWVMDRGEKQELCLEEIEVMQSMLRSVGESLTLSGKPLHLTIQPISVDFLPEWSPRSPDGLALCKGFTIVAREQAKAYLYTQKLSGFGKICPSEEPVVRQFGATVERLIKRTLRRWAEAMKARLERDGPYKPFKDTEHVQLIMDYLRKYHNSYEARFGAMEEAGQGGQLGHIKNNVVSIRSTGYGVKVLMGLMMADRLHVVGRIRQEDRERVAYEQILGSELPDDSKNCPICQDPLDTITPEGTSEPALKLIICCGQTIGQSCLKSWLGRSGQGVRKNCPTCRYPFPPSFLEKLFDGEEPWRDAEGEADDEDMEDAIMVANQRDIVDLVSPSPSQEPEPAPALVPAQAAAEAAAPGDLVRPVFVNPVHTNIPMGLDRLPNLAAAVSVGGAGPRQADDFMMEG